ncbi:MAG TPA: hypothetical protein VNB49_17140 [Candidatus Dormibacteraeota bacterium]|nr:hypothetical protein [Candidatus Dormibacteraeota bacterium]
MKAWLSAPVSLMVLGILAGCGSGKGNFNASNLTKAQAQRLGSAVSADVSNALASALGNVAVPLDISSRDHMLVALHRNSQADTVSKPEDVTCNGTSCTVSGTYACPDGGSIAVSGNFSASSNSASGTITETPRDCSDGTLVINGNPDVTVGVQGNNNGITTTVNVTIGGGVNFSPVQAGQFPTGSCTLNVAASVSVNDSSGSVTSSSISGSVCGQTIP